MDLYLKKTNLLSSADYSIEKARTAVLGIPFDSTSIDRPGSRFGPQALRTAFEGFEGFDFETGTDIYEKSKLCDLGDVEVVPGSFRSTAKRIEDTVERIARKDLLLVSLGGEHSITLPIVNCLQSDISIVCFDAHLDLRDDYLGNKLSHVTFMRRITEFIDPKKIYIYGVRSSSREEKEFAEKSGIHVNNLEGLKGKTYLSIDIDVLDPSFAPGTCSPVPGGMSYSELIEKIKPFAKNLVGIDLCEVSPLYDRSELTAYTGAKLLYALLSYLH